MRAEPKLRAKTVAPQPPPVRLPGRALGSHVALVAGAWLALVLIHYSPHGRYFGHEVLGETALAPPAAAGLFTAGWLIMIVAMMLPAALPVLARLLRGGAVGHVTTWLVGNLSPWLLLGFAFGAADLVVHSVVAPHYPLLVARLPSILWLAAGLRLLLAPTAPNKGDTPPSRPLAHTQRSDFLRGWQYGLACLRDGWALMLAVAAGHGQLGAMAGATILMSAPSYSQLPRWVSTTAGVTLALLGAKLLLAVP